MFCDYAEMSQELSALLMCVYKVVIQNSGAKDEHGPRSPGKKRKTSRQATKMVGEELLWCSSSPLCLVLALAFFAMTETKKKKKKHG